MRNFEANRWLTVGEAMREFEKLNGGGIGYHTIDLGDAGDIDVDCDEGINLDDVQNALIGVSRERAE